MNQDKLYDVGADLYQEGSFSEAINLLIIGHKRYPKNADLIVLLASCFNELHKFTEAARLLLKAEKIKKDDPYITYNLGYTFLCMDRISDGIEYIEKCLKLRPSKEIRNMAKRMLNSKKEFEERFVEPNIPIEEEFRCQEMFLKAQEYLYSDKFEKAISLYKEILNKKPKHASSIQNIGLCYLKNKKTKKAIPYFEKASELDSSDFLSLANLMHAYHLLSDDKKSEYYSKKVMEKIKKPTLRDLIRAVCIFIETERVSLARKLVNKFDNCFENLQLIFLSGVIYAKQKNFHAALEEFADIRKESEIANLYFRKTKDIIKGKIKNYNFEPQIIDWNIEVI